jgi:hypothetical protein
MPQSSLASACKDNTLRTTPYPSLLSESIIGRDFDVDVRDGPHHSQQICFLDLWGMEDYEPVLVGSVSEIFDAVRPRFIFGGPLVLTPCM